MLRQFSCTAVSCNCVDQTQYNKIIIHFVLRHLFYVCGWLYTHIVSVNEWLVLITRSHWLVLSVCWWNLLHVVQNELISGRAQVATVTVLTDTAWQRPWPSHRRRTKVNTRVWQTNTRTHTHRPVASTRICFLKIPTAGKTQGHIKYRNWKHRMRPLWTKQQDMKK